MVDAIIDQAEALKKGLLLQEQMHDDLEIQNAEANAQLERKSSELASINQHLAELQRALPAARDDDVLKLNVGGVPFWTYRSTLMQFENSVLATMVSTRWADGVTQHGGELFFDMDPKLFEEILRSLRTRRIGVKHRMVFSHEASILAQYLGIPVDDILGTKYICMSQLYGSGHAPGFMFDVFMRSAQKCMLRAFELKTSMDGMLTIYMKPGSFVGSMHSKEGWELICREHLLAGLSRITLPRFQLLQVYPDQPLAIYLAFAPGDIYFACTEAPCTYRTDDGVATIPNQELSASRGRSIGEGLFTPGPNSDDCYFHGTIEYSLFRPQESAGPGM